MIVDARLRAAKLTVRSSGLEKPVTATERALLAVFSTSAHVFMGLPSATKNADGCWMTIPSG
jgi:hypothetical protein